ncbi:MAG: hypothetical protein Q9219_004503 [cf. Caloplaca sp. 3 TL-2023]
MSTVAYWLQRQRKPDLQNLAAHVGMKDFDNLLKTDLEVALDEYLRANQPRLQDDPQLSGFYRRITSPVKRESGGVINITSAAEEVKKPKQRRQTIKAREELDRPSDLLSPQPTTTRTMTTTKPPRTPQPPPPPAPASSSSSPSALPFPASPSLLADRIEERTAALTSSFTTLYATSPIPRFLSSLRTNLSSTTSIQLLILFLELSSLLRTLIPLKYLTTLPALPAAGVTQETRLMLPDLFVVLTAGFWGPVGLWVGMGVVLPVLGAWVVDLRRAQAGQAAGHAIQQQQQQHQDLDDPSSSLSSSQSTALFDPVAFGVLKGLLAWIVYLRGWAGGAESRAVVEESVPGGSVGMLVGAGVVVLAGLYEAVLRK